MNDDAFPVAGQLVERKGGRRGTIYPLRQDGTAIGRGPENDIVIPTPEVSWNHARIAWDGDAYVLTDLGSTNGSFLNGCRISASHQLQRGDVITLAGPLGPAFEFHPGATLPVPPISIDVDRLEVWVRDRYEDASGQIAICDRRVDLSEKEFAALALLHGRAGAVVPKDDLVAEVWPERTGAVSEEEIEQLIYRLRKKLEKDALGPRRLQVRRGGGYLLDLL